MKKIRIFLFALVLVGLVVSCSENPGTTTMKLILSTSSEEGGRTILPSDSSLMDVTKYTITGTGPNGKTFTRNTDNSSVDIEGLTIGEWTVTAKGLNREGTVLVSGSKTFRLTATAAPQTIVMDTLVGSGTFSYVLDWSLCDVASPSMDVFLTGPDMDGDEVALAVTLNTETRTATVSETLAAGSYKVRVILKDGSQQVAGLVEAVRISNGTRTSGNHVFHFSELGPSTLMYFRDATGTPIKGTLSASGNPASFLGGSSYTYVFSFSEPEKVNTEGLTIDWYYDGNLAQGGIALDRTGSSYTVEVQNGVHRIDAVVYNRLLGSTGSAAYTFTVVPDGEIGEMALVNESAGSAIPMLDSSTIISPLPSDMFLVVTPNNAKMYVCSVSSGALQIQKTYDSNNFPWLQNTKHMFSSVDMNAVIATDDMNSKENVTCLVFNPTNKTIEAVPGMRFEGSVPAYARSFNNISTAAFCPDKGVIVLSDCGTGGFDFIFKMTGNSITTSGTARRKSSVYYSVNDSDIDASGTNYVYCSLSSSSFVSAQMLSTGQNQNTAVSQAADSAISHVRFVNTQTVVATSSYEITTFKVAGDLGSAYTRYKTIGMSVVDIQADGSNYFYVADNSNRLVSFEATGNEIVQLGATVLADPISRICLSGRYLAAFTEANAIALFEVIQ